MASRDCMKMRPVDPALPEASSKRRISGTLADERKGQAPSVREKDLQSVPPDLVRNVAQAIDARKVINSHFGRMVRDGRGSEADTDSVPSLIESTRALLSSFLAFSRSKVPSGFRPKCEIQLGCKQVAYLGGLIRQTTGSSLFNSCSMPTKSDQFHIIVV